MDKFIEQSLAVIEAASYGQNGLGRLDANETAFLERELTQLRTKTLDVQYGAIKGLTVVPLATDIAPSAETYSTKVYDYVGKARIGGPKNAAPPRVDVQTGEILGKVYTVDAAYGWDVLEMREAARMGVSLSDRKAMAARKAIDYAIDDMLISGKPSTETTTNLQTVGFANGTGVSVMGSAFTNWVQGTTTDDVIVAELNAFVDQQLAGTLDNEGLKGDTLVLPTSRYLIANSTRLGVDSDKTALSWFKANRPEITVIPWARMQGVTSSAKDRACFYKRSPDVLEGVVPILFENLAPQTQGLEFIVNCFARCGGVKVYNPTGMLYRDWP